MWSGVRAYRRKVLTDGIDERLKQLIHEGCQRLCAEIEELEVMPDHVHLLVSVDPQFGIHRLIKARKAAALLASYGKNTHRCGPVCPRCGPIRIL